MRLENGTIKGVQYRVIADTGSLEAPNGRLQVLVLPATMIHDAIALPGDTEETLLREGWLIAKNHASLNPLSARLTSERNRSRHAPPAFDRMPAVPGGEPGVRLARSSGRASSGAMIRPGRFRHEKNNRFAAPNSVPRA